MRQSPELKKAVSAAVHIAEAIGLSATAPHILQHSNHTTIHLRPYPVVARVRLNIRDPQSRARLHRELEICRYLSDRGAPTVAPARDLDPGPHFHQDVGVTLWTFVEHRPSIEQDWPAALSAYRELHRCMIDFVGSLPSFLDQIAECRAALLQEDRLFGLSKAELDFLRATSDSAMAKLGRLHVSALPLHGDPHLGNVVISPNGPLWGDFESVCLGPLEWDLSCFPVSLGRKCEIDLDLLKVLRGLRSVCVVVWCSMNADRNSRKQQAAAFHLKRLQSSH